MRHVQQLLTEQLVVLLSRKPIEQITVKELAESCHVSRQTFYYYFQDIYEVLEKYFLQESKRLVGTVSESDDWKTCYSILLRWMKDHRSLVINSFRGNVGNRERSLVNQILCPYLEKLIEQEEHGLKVEPEQKEFLIRYYIIAITGLTGYWIETGMKEEPEEAAEKTALLFKGHARLSMENFSRANKGETE